ncbi:hypothetical protein [Pseudomonas sp.]|jgi:hypothetical protein|uniref:hypothetical protein n=1 Tax=Pseudomonas sp. TaxID=306 RepID=UPI00272BC0B9|nr:hypothetical protein [Pseudomonas sp.]
MSSTDTVVSEAAQRPRKNPFARLHVADIHWVLLKPVFKARLLTQPERLARVTSSHERVAMLELFRVEVRLDGDPAPEQGNVLEVMVDHRHQRVRFGPADTVSMTPSGRGLGGYLLSQLIEWLQRNCPGYLVTPIHLADHDLPDQARQARDRLLQRAGFELHYPDPANGIGRAQVNDVSGLIAGWNTERVQFCRVGDLLAELREQEGQIARQQAQLNTLRASLDNYQRTDAGNRFAIGCLLVFSLFQALLLLWVVLR